MNFQIYNTLTKKKEEFEPLVRRKVKMYVCGPTVYDESHVGHARTYIYFDILRKYLEEMGYYVKYVINITDVDDKILDKAKKENRTPRELTQEMTAKFLTDYEALGNQKPTEMPRVTDNIDEIIRFISVLIEKGYAYEAAGDVYFAVREFSKYGELSGNKIEDLNVGARIQPGEVKHDPLDFALWKKTKKEEALSFKSPWGPGRPGWHIECSALATKYLGETIDIHGGGNDLIFPHHEDERAQSEAASDKNFAKYWIHTGMVTVNGEKMSKSLGNFITIAKILEKYEPALLRFHVIKTHYRRPLDFDEKTIDSSASSLQTIREFALRLKKVETMKDDDLRMTVGYQEKFFEALADDFNTPKALAILFDYVKEMNKLIDTGILNKHDDQQGEEFLAKVNAIFGLDLFKKIDVPHKIIKLAAEREKARQTKNWQKSDELRAEINDLGYEVEDTASGPRIRKA